MKWTNFLCAVSFILVISGITFSQVTVDLTVENQIALSTDFYFDIFLTRTGTSDLYLGNADFVFTFNHTNFNSPSITKEGTSPGFCTFVPTDPTGMNILFTQDFYFSNTAVEILNGQEIVINLNGPAPADQGIFDTRVAKIDSSISTHCLGRFKVSGISNPSGTMDLSWKTGGTGVVTRVFTLAPISPWTSSPVAINAIDPPTEPIPVELTSFNANNQESMVQLSWTTATETNNFGFDLERKLKGNENEWSKIGFIEGAGNSSSPKKYEFMDKNPFGGSEFVYRLKQIDADGKFKYSDEIEIIIVPMKYKLYQNFPNPFNPATKIRFALVEPQKVDIKLYNSIGEEVYLIINKQFDSGYHEIEFNAGRLASGIYFYRISAGNFAAVKKMLVLK